MAGPSSAQAARRKKIGEGFGKIAKALVGVGLPILGNAVAGPYGGAAAAKIANALGLGPDATEDQIALTLAEADPMQLVELRRIEAEQSIAEHERFTAEHDGYTRRHEADALSDSWLARNVRPMILVTLLGAYLILVFLAALVFDGDKFTSTQALIEMLTPLLMAVFGYYFGSRGVEKVARVVKGGAA